jgi:hypothetical protein
VDTSNFGDHHNNSDPCFPFESHSGPNCCPLHLKLLMGNFYVMSSHLSVSTSHLYPSTELIILSMLIKHCHDTLKLYIWCLFYYFIKFTLVSTNGTFFTYVSFVADTHLHFSSSLAGAYVLLNFFPFAQPM